VYSALDNVTFNAHCNFKDYRLFIAENLVVNCADVKDFIPAPLENNSYEGFETLVDRANSWLEELTGVVHFSLQSVLVQKGDRKSFTLSFRP